MLIPGFATAEGTARFRARHESRLPGHFRQANGLWISTIGLGTYLGEPTPAFDERYTEAVTRAVALGTNHFDSAINYRHQRSERSIAAALGTMFDAGTLRRDEVVIATKGGFLTFDSEEPPDPAAYFHEKLIATGLVRPEEVAAGCHVMSPSYLENQIDQSRRNLGVETIDLYYLHNPETQLGEISRAEFDHRLRGAFAALEHAVGAGKIRSYGTATWNAYRQEPESRESLSLAEILRVAEEVGGKDHHFRAVQLPFNLAMPEALAAQTQSWEGHLTSFLEVARAHHLMVFASASIMQGHLAQGIPADIRRFFPGLSTDAQCALQFVRSAPGITCALVGMSRREHVEENLATARVAPLSVGDFHRLFAK
jgi:aryl-alcohol dehydrogenase-like predicted oxidoreductase